MQDKCGMGAGECLHVSRSILTKRLVCHVQSLAATNRVTEQ
jgi:hypothetical protein